MDYSQHDPHHQTHATAGAPPNIAIDPVCGMEVDTTATDRVVVRNGVSWYFCNDK